MRRRSRPAASSSSCVPRLGDAALVEHDDQVRRPNGREPVRDDERCPARRQAGQRVLHQPLGLRVQRAGGLVQQQDRGVLQDRAGQRNPLALAARQARSPVTKPRFVALRQRGDEIVRRGGARGSLDFRL